MQPPKKKTPSQDIDADFAALVSQPPSSTGSAIDPDFASLLSKPTPKTESFLDRAKETVTDAMVAGLGAFPGMASVYSALTPVFQPGKTMQEGAQQFIEAKKTARARSPVASNPFMPHNIAMSALPYAIPAGQGTALARSLYSAGVGALRGGEEAALAGEPAADVAKKAMLGAGVEAVTGAILGEPAGAMARSRQVPTRVAQVKEKLRDVRQAETPLYEEFKQLGKLELTPTLEEAAGNTIIARAIKSVMQSPKFKGKSPLEAEVLDRAYKIVGSKAFSQQFNAEKQAVKEARDLLAAGMDEAAEVASGIPGQYSNILTVASKGRGVVDASKLGAEATRFASQASPGTMSSAMKLGKESLADYLARATPAQRQAVGEAAYGYLREAPKFAAIPLPRGGRIPIPLIPSRAAYQAPKIAQMAGVSPTTAQRMIRGGTAGAPSTIGSSLYRFFTGEE
jgi:hypothetical protein